MEVYRQLHGGVCVCKGTLYMDVRETFVGVNGSQENFCILIAGAA